MSYYFIAQIQIHDKEEYQKYIDKSRDVFKKYNGEYLSVDNDPLLLEGDWKHDRLVLIQFKSKTDFEDWYNSSDYQEILKYRLSSANCDSILVKGLS